MRFNTRFHAFRVLAPNIGTGTGAVNFNDGFIRDQTKLLEEFQDGLALYNDNPDPFVDMLSFLVTHDRMIVPQAPLYFGEDAEGTRPGLQRVVKRALLFPLRTFTAETGWTKQGLQDMKVREAKAEHNAAIKGDAERVTGLMAAAIFRPRTAGSVADPYRASFYNGETDVPAYGENTFDSAHSHYKGLNTTTLAGDHLTACIEDIVEHGYEGPYVGLFSTAQMDAVAAIQEPNSGQSSAERSRSVDQGVQDGVMVRGVRCLFRSWVPAGYFAVISTAEAPLGRREHEEEEYRGLQQASDSKDANLPLIGTSYMRRIDFSVGHLGAGVARQLVASTTYTAPTMRFQ